MKETIQDKMHQYISFRAHLIFIAHRQLLSIKKHSKKNAAFFNSPCPCEQTDSYIFHLAQAKQLATTRGTKFPPSNSASPLLNFTVEKKNLNQFSVEAYEYVRHIDMQYILTQTQTTISEETVVNWGDVDLFIARFILENPRLNGIIPMFNFFNPTNPLTTFFQHKNIIPTQSGWAIQSILDELPSINPWTDPIWYSRMGELFYNAFTLEKFAIVAVDSDDTSSNRHALLVDTNRNWRTWVSDQQNKLKINSAIDTKNKATLNPEIRLQKMKTS